jgi:Na+-driven multidrug efflux pump
VGLFNKSPQVLYFGGKILLLAAFFQLFDGVGIIRAGGLRGAGDTRWTMYVGVTFAWLLFAPLAFLFGMKLEMGVVGAWVGASIYIVILGLTMLGRFRSKKWLQIQI